jgi:hypothetical protein
VSSQALKVSVFILFPVAIANSVIRYRLYDIERLISRTLAYGLLTVLLAGVYASVVLVLGQLFGGGAGRDPPSWAVAGATLAVAALFQPARRRISRPWTDASTGAATTPPRRSRRSASACATTSTWTRPRPSCWRWSTRPWNRPKPHSGSDAPPNDSGGYEQPASDRTSPARLLLWALCADQRCDDVGRG